MCGRRAIGIGVITIVRGIVMYGLTVTGSANDVAIITSHIAGCNAMATGIPSVVAGIVTAMAYLTDMIVIQTIHIVANGSLELLNKKPFPPWEGLFVKP
jgi:hypothetical protein